jgi:hypothetical protein
MGRMHFLPMKSGVAKLDLLYPGFSLEFPIAAPGRAM